MTAFKAAKYRDREKMDNVSYPYMTSTSLSERAPPQRPHTRFTKHDGPHRRMPKHESTWRKPYPRLVNVCQARPDSGSALSLSPQLRPSRKSPIGLRAVIGKRCRGT